MIGWFFSGLGTMLLSTAMQTAPIETPPPKPNWVIPAEITLSAPAMKDSKHCWDTPKCWPSESAKPDLVLCIVDKNTTPYCPARADLWVKKCKNTVECKVQGTIPNEKEFTVFLLDLDLTDIGTDIIGSGKCKPNVECELKPMNSNGEPAHILIEPMSKSE